MSRPLLFTRKLFLYRLFGPAAAIMCVVLMVIVFYSAHPASAEIPPAAEKKTVTLEKSHVDAEHVFAAECSKCHKLPDPAQPALAKPDCTKGMPERDRVQVQIYMTDVRTGKSLYESHCGRCHELIAPGLHTADYWSKNLCTSDECFVKKLNSDQEQQLLLYLTTHAKKN